MRPGYDAPGVEKLKERYRWGSPPRTLQGILLLPEVAAALLPIAALLRVDLHPHRWVGLLATVAALWMTFSGRRSEAALARWTLKLRRPRRRERERLEELAGQILQAAGSDIAPTILIQRSDHINALAYGRRTVAVTDTALQLDDRHLAAILAHEIGHLDEKHTTFGVLRLLLHAPLRLYNEIGGFLAFSSPVTAVIGIPLVLGSFILSLPIRAADLLYRPVARWEERSADLYASRAGHGIALAEVLHAPRPGRMARARNLLSTHPHGHARSRTLIEAEMRRERAAHAARIDSAG